MTERLNKNDSVSNTFSFGNVSEIEKCKVEENRRNRDRNGVVEDDFRVDVIINSITVLFTVI